MHWNIFLLNGRFLKDSNLNVYLKFLIIFKFNFLFNFAYMKSSYEVFPNFHFNSLYVFKVSSGLWSSVTLLWFSFMFYQAFLLGFPKIQPACHPSMFQHMIVSSRYVCECVCLLWLLAIRTICCYCAVDFAVDQPYSPVGVAGLDNTLSPLGIDWMMNCFP